MSRKSFLLSLSILLVLVGVSAGSLILLVRHEPASYIAAAVPPGPQRSTHSKDCQEQFTEMLEAWIPGNERPYEVKLTEKQINSYFAEDFRKSNIDRPLETHNIRDPRIILKDDCLSLAFRYGKGLWSSVISIDFRIWLPKQGEPNVVAMEVQKLKAGCLSISAQSLLKEVSQMAQENDIEVNWYRYKGNPVALINFQPGQSQPTMRLERILIEDGTLIIRGRPVASEQQAGVKTDTRRASRK